MRYNQRLTTNKPDRVEIFSVTSVAELSTSTIFNTNMQRVDPGGTACAFLTRVSGKEIWIFNQKICCNSFDLFSSAMLCRIVTRVVAEEMGLRGHDGELQQHPLTNTPTIVATFPYYNMNRHRVISHFI